MLDRTLCEAAFRDAIDACDPVTLVRLAVETGPWLTRTWRGRSRYGIAIGKAALAMARGLGGVERGVAVTNVDDHAPVPPGWHVVIGSHPEPDHRSLAAGDEVIDVVASASERDVIVVLVSGGASSLVERPAGVTFDRFRDDIRSLVASGAPIREINRARAQRSAIKGGKLAAMAVAPIVTLAISDVVGDDLAVIGSGPTILEPMRAGDDAILIAKLDRFARAMASALGRRGVVALDRLGHRAVDPAPLADDVAVIADRLATADAGVRVCFGEPTLQLPADRGDGGRAQQLALELAWRLRGTTRAAFVAGSDGIDGPPPRGRPAPAGAFVDGRTWEAIAAAGVDPNRALERRDAGTALDAVGALVVTGATGVNHADVVVVG